MTTDGGKLRMTVVKKNTRSTFLMVKRTRKTRSYRYKYRHTFDGNVLKCLVSLCFNFKASQPHVPLRILMLFLSVPPGFV